MCLVKGINSSCKNINSSKWGEKGNSCFTSYFHLNKSRDLWVGSNAGRSQAISKGFQWDLVAEKQMWCFSCLRHT